MKYYFFLLFVVVLAGCTLTENYSVQYGFSNEISTETKFDVTDKIINAEVPFADFSCDQKSFKATLSRNNQILTMRLKGTETAERCSAKFFTSISGLTDGNYQFRLVYEHDGKTDQVMSKDFSIP